MNRSLYPARQPALQSGAYRHGDSNPGTDPASFGLNELGAPDFQWWRERAGEQPEPNGQPAAALFSNGRHCPHCQYPMLKGEATCPRCGRRRA